MGMMIGDLVNIVTAMMILMTFCTQGNLQVRMKTALPKVRYDLEYDVGSGDDRHSGGGDFGCCQSSQDVGSPAIKNDVLRVHDGIKVPISNDNVS